MSLHMLESIRISLITEQFFFSVNAARLLKLDNYLLHSVAKRDGTTIKFVVSKSPNKSSSTKNTSTLNEIDTSPTTLLSEDFDQCPGSDHGQNMEIETQSDRIPNTSNSDHLPAPNLSKHNYSDVSVMSKTPLKAGDDNFISEFYTHSRLHHLAMWKSELKKFASSIQKKRKERSSSNANSNVAVKNRIIMHIDLDSFFVSVALKMQPELIGKPVAVCHSGRENTMQGKNLANSWSEIASCSYEARSFGLHNGMMLNKAKKLCPQLICVPYYFDEYRKVSQTFYEILSNFTCNIEAVSCDEALLDVTELFQTGESVLDLAEIIRLSVLKETGCTASCGIGNSILIAKLATRQAKPNGKCYITREQISDFIVSQQVKQLPGIGWAQGKKLEDLNVSTCKDLQMLSLHSLQKEFGQKLGETLFKFCRGQDDRQIVLDHERKSVSAEINYGMRFKEHNEVEKFICQLSLEVEKRLKDIQRVGKHITFKLMTRQKDAAQPAKYMGHGWCDTLSRSCPLPIPTDNSKIIAEKCCSIIRNLQIHAEDVRGMGIQITKLSDVKKQSALSASLFNFTKPISIEELHKRDNILNSINIEKDDVLPKKTMKLDHFMKSTSNTKVILDRNKEGHKPELPALPSFEVLTSNYRQSIKLTKKYDEKSGLQGPSSDWDQSVLKELPEDIQNELRRFQSNHQPASILETNTSNNSSTTLLNLKESSSRKSPVTKSPKQKGRGRPTKASKFDSSKYGDVRFAVHRVSLDKQLHVNIRTNPTTTTTGAMLNSAEDNGILSPSKVDIDVVKELPDDIRNEIISNMRKSGHITIHSKLEKSTKVSKQAATKDSENKHIYVKDAPTFITLSKKFDHQYIMSPSQLDQSIMRLLPDDIKEDVLADAYRVKEKNDTNNQYLLSPSQMDQSILRSLPDDIREDVLADAHRAKENKKEKKATCDSVLLLKNENLKYINPNQRTDQKQVNFESRGTSFSHDMLLSPSQLDPAVYNALPVAMQQEVMQQAKAEKRRRQRQKDVEHNNRVHDQQQTSINLVKEVIKPIVKKKLKQVMPDINGVSSYLDVKEMIRQWVHEYDEPLAEDITEFIGYCNQLLYTFNMETLMNLLSFLRRLSSGKTLWHVHFNDILQNTQDTMKIKYKGCLPIMMIM